MAAALDGSVFVRSRMGMDQQHFQASSSLSNVSSDRSTNIGQYSLFIEGLPSNYDWRDLKDLVRQRASHGIRGDVYTRRRGGKQEKIGIAKLIKGRESIDVYTWLTTSMKDSRFVVHLFDASDGSARLMMSNCIPTSCSCCARHNEVEERSDYAYNAVSNTSILYSQPRSSAPIYSSQPAGSVLLSNTGLPINTRAGVVRVECRSVFVRGLDFKIGKPELEALFSKAGQIVKSEVHMDRRGKSKGTAIIEYESTAEAQQAATVFNNWKWHGRVMQVRMDRQATASEIERKSVKQTEDDSDVKYGQPVIVNGSGSARVE